ncbi:TSUP family transporter [Streptomyces sp. NPDC059957]|uniref:TSUP family transporter n=1 Tax=unclassified Streptomyces TaxID=2593676 RepID=UPI00365F6E1D
MTIDQSLVPLRATRPAPVVFAAGAAIGVLGGMIGLGGAEFRLPLLIGLFGFAALSAVILNKAMSLVVVLVALPARLAAVPAADVAARWPVAVNLLAGSLLGAWAGATWALRMRSATLYKVLAALMVLMAAALMVTHTTTLGTLDLPLWAQVPAGVVAGFGIGVVAAIMGVAGGELLILRSCCCSVKTSRPPAASPCWSRCRPCSWRSPATAATAASPPSAPTSASP